MTSLFDATLELATELGGVFAGVAESGTTTTCVDTSIPGSDDDWNGGTIWFETGDNANVYSEIKNFASATGTITTEDTLATAVATGDDFLICKPTWPLSMLKNSVNRELRKIKIPQTDITTITIADEKTEYNLPAAATDLREVYMQADDDDANDNRWYRINWEMEYTATGTANKIIFDRQYTADYNAKLVYVITHPRLQDASDTISELIDLERIIPGAAIHAIIERNRLYRSGDDFDSELIKYYRDLKQMAEIMHSVRLPSIQGNVMTAHSSSQAVEDKIGDI